MIFMPGIDLPVPTPDLAVCLLMGYVLALLSGIGAALPFLAPGWPQ